MTHQNDAYRLGAAMAQDGCNIGSNPYPRGGGSHSEWRNGWKDSAGRLEEGQVWTFAGANGRTQEIEIVSLDSDAGTVVYAQSELIPDHLLALLPAGVTRHQIGTDTDAIAGLSRYLASVHAHLLADQSPTTYDARSV